jgi:hypothetical protein
MLLLICFYLFKKSKDLRRDLNLSPQGQMTTEVTKGGFYKSWAHGVKHKVHPNLSEKAISWA